MRNIPAIVAILALSSALAPASIRAASPGTALTEKLTARCRQASGSVGVAVLHVESGRMSAANGDKPFPLFSVFKLPVAVTVLTRVQDKRLSLERKVHVTPAEIVAGVAANTQRWKKPVDMMVRQLLEYSIIHSDNTATDQLLRLVGGPAVVSGRMKALGLPKIEVKYSVSEFIARKGINNQASAADLARLLAKIQKGEALKPAQRDALLGMMEKVETGTRRLRAKLPSGTIVADKTGTGPPARGTHDIGIITLPGNKGHLAMAVLISGSHLSTGKQEDVIADLARIAYDWYTRQE